MLGMDLFPGMQGRRIERKSEDLNTSENETMTASVRTSVLHEEFQIAHIEAAVPSGGFALRTNSRLLSSKSRFASSGREMGN